MARYAKDNGVAKRDIGDGVEITVQFDRELKWQVSVTGSANEANTEAIVKAYQELLEDESKALLEEVGGKPGPQYGTTQGYLFAYVTARLGFKIHQNPATGEGGGKPGEPVF